MSRSGGNISLASGASLRFIWLRYRWQQRDTQRSKVGVTDEPEVKRDALKVPLYLSCKSLQTAKASAEQSQASSWRPDGNLQETSDSVHLEMSCDLSPLTTGGTDE